jgi:SAM-dependent methyltransferase
MGKAEWGVDAEFFGPRHAHREGRILNVLRRGTEASGLHLECAAGVGSLSLTLVREGRTVVAADTSLRSLAEIARRASAHGEHGGPLLVVADIIRLPFTDSLFASATTAETLEHIPDDARAVQELARVLQPGGILAGTVPAGPSQWSDWDEWAGHLRRYTRDQVTDLLSRAGFEPRVTVWGWPLLRLYDDFFLKRINRRRLHHEGKLEDDPSLGRVSGLGRVRGLVAVVRSIFALDRFFDGVPWGVGLIFVAKKGRHSQGS